MAKKKRKLPHIRLKLVTWIALWLMAFLLPLAWRRVSQPEQTEAAWWNDAWHYRQRVDVTNNTSEETNVYIALTLDTSDTTKFQANCGDLRFTKQNGQLLQYYLVSGCGTASTSIHVQFDAFPAGAQSVYAYYGNAAAEAGFASADFSTEASDYTIGGVASEEVGPGPVAYWKFDEGSGNIAHDSVSYGLGDELMADGDMEAADTSAYTGLGATVSKQTANPHEGTRLLRITNTDTNGRANQNVGITEGKKYRIHGYVRSDGSATPRLNLAGVQDLWSGSNSTDWQEIEVSFVSNWTTNLRIYTNGAASLYTEWDDISVTEVVSGNQGTISGATWASEDQCGSGKCLSFDGVDDYVDIYSSGLGNDLNASEGTIAVWAKVNDSGAWSDDTRRTILNLRTSSGVNILTIRKDNDNQLEWYYKTSATTIKKTTTSTDFMFLVLTWSQDRNEVKAYLNGSQEGSTLSFPGVIEGSLDSSQAAIGAATNSGSYPWNGLIDEVKIFPYALSEDQIKTEYNLGSASVVGEAATVAPPPNGTLKDSLVAHWSFDEQAGQTVHDKVGGNDGTRGADANAGSDDPAWKPANECKVNGCASFDGGADYVNISSHGSEINLTDDLTMIAWIKTTSGAGALIYSGTASSWGHRLGVSSGKITGTFIQVSPSVASETITGNTLINDGQWHHVAVVRENGSALSVHVDGTLDKTDVAQNLVLRTGTGRTIATYNSTSFFSGLIDEVKIYNTALTADQVKQDMNAGAAIVYGVTADEADELSDGAGDPPIAEWKFDEKQGTTAYDTSGNENNGTVNGATWKSACKQGACLEFDGVNSVVDLGSATGVYTGDITLSAWIRTKSTSTSAIISRYANHGYYTYRMYLNGNGQVVFNRGYDGLWKTDAITVDSVNDGQWHFVTAVYDSENMSIYVDGTLKAATPETRLSDPSTLWHLCIGTSRYNCAPGSSDSFDGLIDHVKIYDYARTPAQIAYDYNRGKPIAHWKFDECEGTVAHDSSGNDNHGTINIGATGSQTTAGTCQTSGAWGNGASGKFNGSLNFDGTDDYVNMGDPTDGSLDFGTTDFTLSSWVKTSSSAQQNIVGKYYAYPLYYMRLNSGVFEARIASDSSNNFQGTDGTAINDNAWHHIVAVYDRSGNMTRYVDGKVYGSTVDISGLISTSINNGNNFTIGNAGGAGGTQFTNGQIDDVRIYNYALSPAQIQKVMNEGMAVRYGPATGAQ